LTIERRRISWWLIAH